jgi:hypothetical protein
VYSLSSHISLHAPLLFTFVRNPYTRALSCYLDKILGDKKEKRKLLDSVGRKQSPTTTPISFYEFLCAIEHQDVRDNDVHWRPQYYQSYHGNLTYDFIGRFEQLEEDLRCVCDRLGLDLATYYLRQDPHRTSAELAIAQYYGIRERNLVEKIYELDFDTFGYEHSLPLPG